MKTRVISAAAGLALFILIVYAAPSWAAVAAFCLICAIAAYEALHNTHVLEKGLPLWLCCLAAFCLPAATAYDAAYLLPLLYAFSLALFLWAVLHPQQITFEQIAQCYLGAFVLPFLLSGVLRILVQYEKGRLYVLAPFLAAWCCDSFAQITGILFGKRKLIPQVSPKKTVEGSAGGLLGGVAGLLIYGFIAGRWFGGHPNYPLLAIGGLAGSLAGMLGDLAMSLLKRKSGIKDYGNIMPGHGGILDRFDSVLFTAPLFELLFRFTDIL